MMANVDVYSQDRKKVSSVTLGAGWNERVRKGCIYETALWQMAGRRSGTASTKLRSEVRGSGRKIYRQKGTGNARHADRQAPIFVGGGVVGGPRPRDWSYSIPKKERRRAIQSLMIHKLHNDRLRVLDSLDFSEIKTKRAKEFFSKWEVSSALVVLDKLVENVVRSVQNLPRFKTCSVDSLNAVDLLVYDFVILTEPAFKEVEKKWLERK